MNGTVGRPEKVGRPKHFAITGVAGFVAPRHLQAIHETNNELVAACDPHDAVGLLDRYGYDTAYFREFERFDRYLEKLRRNKDPRAIDYLSICSPNYLHDAHIRLALRLRADAICEKPLVLNPWNCDALEELEREYGKKIYTILQLRLHPSVVALREQLRRTERAGRPQVELAYITARGPWYRYSWKGNLEQSGGLATNIGIHFFDLLLWLFGPAKGAEVELSEPAKVRGRLELERADVRWNLSIDVADLPAACREQGRTTYRSIRVDGQELEFSSGFADLHSESYRQILAGRGFGIAEARPSIELAHRIRQATAKLG